MAPCTEEINNLPRRISASDFSVSEFIEECLIENKPIIITGCTQNWLAAERWINKDGTVDFAFLLDRFGDKEVPVTCCKTRKVQTMLFSDFIQRHVDNPSLYIRDWHFMSDSTERWYEVPRYFRDDWVNDDALEHHDIFGGDYRFCYMGGSGTFTGFHADVFNSYSWSANICGKKIWHMLPEAAERGLSTNAEDIVDVRTDPLFSEAGGFTFEQLPGEVVFVPTAWFHQGFTISINHNWINSFNLGKVIELLLERLHCCKKEVRLIKDDVEDCVKTVEEFLRLDYGLNVKTATALCEMILKRRSLTIDIDKSNLKKQCTCLSSNLDYLCDSCAFFMHNNDLLICRKTIKLLEEARKSLYSPDWLNDTE